MINSTKQENLKVESSIETEKKELKFKKLKMSKLVVIIQSLITTQKRKKKKGKKSIQQMKLKMKV